MSELQTGDSRNPQAPRNNLALFFMHLLVDKMGTCQLGVLEGETNSRSMVRSSTVLWNSMRTARAQGAALGVAARAAAFPVRAVAQVPTQLERSDSISLAALINRVHFQKLFSLRRWNSWGTGGIASVTHHN